MPGSEIGANGVGGEASQPGDSGTTTQPATSTVSEKSTLSQTADHSAGNATLPAETAEDPLLYVATPADWSTAAAVQPLENENENENEATQQRSETDSSYGDDDQSATTSITSSVYRFTEENGRTYHSYEAGKYLMPNDEPEMDRMDIHYHAIRVLFGDRAIFSPINPNPQMILDQATGTGIWVMDVGDLYPQATIIGTDLSPIQPTWVPPNVEFRIDDIEKPWLFPEHTFDLVHSRLCSGMAIRNWPTYLSEAYRVSKPGAWVESQEFTLQACSDDNSCPAGGPLVEWHDLFCQAALQAGFDMRMTGDVIEQLFRDAGFVNVQRVDFKMPIGPWAKDPKLREAGSLTFLGMMDGIEGLSMALFTRIMGWTRERFEVFLAEVRQEWKQRKIHVYWPMFVIYGQRPEEG